MYGRGLYLYVTKVVGEGDNRKVVRVPVTDEYPQFMQWLNSWQRKGLPSYKEYCRGVLYDYYYHEGFYSQWHLNRGRGIGVGLPVAGLQHRAVTKCRLAYKGQMHPTETIEDEMLNKVIYNRWDFPEPFRCRCVRPLRPCQSAQIGHGHQLFARPCQWRRHLSRANQLCGIETLDQRCQP